MMFVARSLPRIISQIIISSNGISSIGLVVVFYDLFLIFCNIGVNIFTRCIPRFVGSSNSIMSYFKAEVRFNTEIYMQNEVCRTFQLEIKYEVPDFYST